MKNQLLVLIILMGFCTVSSAQLGVRGGINLSNFAISEDGAESDSKLGLQFGLTYGYDISDDLQFRPGLIYTSKGNKVSFEIDNPLGPGSISFDAKKALGYLEIPLDLKYSFGGEESGPFVTAGPYIGILLTANAKSDGDSQDIKDTINGFDLGFNFSVGYDVNTNIGVGLGYGLGFLNTSDMDGDDSTATNRNIFLYGVYSF